MVERLRAAGRRFAGPVPLGYWIALYAGFFLIYGLYHGFVTTGRFRPWIGDSLYYTAMGLRDAGHSLPDAFTRIQHYFAGPDVGDVSRLCRGFYSCQDQPRNVAVHSLLLPRRIYPWTTAALYPIFGVSAIWAAPLVSGLVVVWATMRLLTRLFDLRSAAIVTGAFLLTWVFWAYGTGAVTEGLCMAFVALLLLNLPLGRTVGRWNLVWLAVLIVLLGFTRQATVVPLGAVFCAWLWTAIREGGSARRLQWRNNWTATAIVSTTVSLACLLYTQIYAKYDAIGWMLHSHKLKSRGQLVEHLPGYTLSLLWSELRHYFWTDPMMLLLWIAAIAYCVIRARTDYSALMIGAALPSLLLAVINGVQTNFRYYMPMYPILLLAAAAFVTHLRARRSGEGTAAAVGEPVTAGQT